ncbi:MAG: signal peptidase II [Chloroflexota bacterium]
MKSTKKDLLTLLALALPPLLLDQLSKAWVRAALPLGQVLAPEAALSQYARIVHVRNYGAAGGIFQQYGWVFLVIALLFSVGVVYYFPRVPAEKRLLRWGLGLLLGGALGNLVDRALFGHVTDFISIGGLPALNLADLCVLAGVLLLAGGLWKDDSH